MKGFFNKVYWISLVSSIMFFFFGLSLVFETEGVIKTVSIIIGALLLIIGMVPIINYFRNRGQGFFASATFLYGVFSVVAGLMIMFNSDILATIIPILAGVWMIVNSVNKIQLSMELRDNKIKFWLTTFIFAVIILVVGALFIINPLKSTFLLTKTFGIVIIIYAVLDITDCIFIKIKSKNIYKKFDIVKDVD